MKFEWRKMRRGVLGGCMVVTIAVGVLSALLSGEGVIAATPQTVTTKTTCQNIVDKKVTNASLLKACNLWKSNGYKLEWGALWISNIGASNLSLEAKVVTDNLTISNDRLNVYMRGAVIGGTNNKFAECIELPNYLSFMQTNVVLDGKCVLKKNGQTLRTVPNYKLLRPVNPDAFNKGITFAGTTLQLNLYSINGDPDGSDGYVGWGGTPNRTGGRIVYKNVGVDVYRCMEGTREDGSTCYSDKSEISIEGNVMRAKATVKSKSNGATSTTDYTTNTSKEAGMLMLSNCEKGCEVEFSHEIKEGEYAFGHVAYYNITNEINRPYESWKSVLDMDGSEGRVDMSEVTPWIRQKTIVLYPGEIYCSRMDFGVTLKKKPGTLKDGELRYVKVCAAAMGILKTDIGLDISKVNKTVGMGYINGIYYVQPGAFNFTTNLGTNVQKVYDIKLEKVNIDRVLFSQSSRSKTLNGIFKEGGLTWSNNLSLYIDNNLVNSWTYLPGTYCNENKGAFSRNVVLSEDWVCGPKVTERTFGADSVGKQYIVEAVINKTDKDKENEKVPAQIEFEKYVDLKSKETFLSAVVQNTRKGYRLSVGVPYNFITNTDLVLVNNYSASDYDGVNDKIVLSNNSIPIKYGVSVGKRLNGLMGTEYVTKVDQAQSGVIWCKTNNYIQKTESTFSPSLCVNEKYEEVTYNNKDFKETFEPNENNENDEKNKRTISVELEDQETGSIICMWSWVSPKDSGDKMTIGDLPWNKQNITYSKPVCGRVGKSPAIQVWGGNVFSGGPLKVSSLFSREFDQGEGKESEKRYYGSFGELGVFVSSTDNAKNFASGAALGYERFSSEGPNDPQLWPSQDGSNGVLAKEEGLYGGWDGKGDMTPLSFDSLKNYNIGNYSDGVWYKLCNREGISGPLSGNIGATEGDYCFDYSNDGQEEVLIEGGIELGKGKKVVIFANKPVKIANNLTYSDGPYGALSEMPKWVIIANNINISCNVTEIDALLITKGTVDTCADGTKVNNAPFRDALEYSNQLTIYGAVIANKLVANRTFGAGPGVYSIVPAEIIKFDPSLYDLGIGSAGSEPRIVDVTELAPRY